MEAIGTHGMGSLIMNIFYGLEIDIMDIMDYLIPCHYEYTYGYID